MKISVLTLFPEFIESLYSYSIIGRALEEGFACLEIFNIRDFSEDKHKKVDDYSYGGGPGMVMKAQPVVDAIAHVKTEGSKVIYLSPQGKPLSQEKLLELVKEDHIILLNGHYEGIDYRVMDVVDEEISLGDFVLSGGEIPTMALIDGVVRLIPGVLKGDEAVDRESHMNGLLEYPQYTRPSDFRGKVVPSVLLSGNHQMIEQFRHEEALRLTKEKRPDLLEKYEQSLMDEKPQERRKSHGHH